MKTISARAQDIDRAWYVIDAEGQTLGRLASEVASILRGKWKPLYTTHVDCGDHVVIVNCERVKLTGNKESQKTYFTHSRYPGGDKQTPIARMRERKPEQIIRLAVRGMLPKTKLGRQMITKLKIYAGPDHPHASQNPLKHVCGTQGRTLEGRS